MTNGQEKATTRKELLLIAALAPVVILRLAVAGVLYILNLINESIPCNATRFLPVTIQWPSRVNYMDLYRCKEGFYEWK